MNVLKTKPFTSYVLLSVQIWLMVLFSNKKRIQENPPEQYKENFSPKAPVIQLKTSRKRVPYSRGATACCGFPTQIRNTNGFRYRFTLPVRRVLFHVKCSFWKQNQKQHPKKNPTKKPQTKTQPKPKTVIAAAYRHCLGICHPHL